MNESKYPYELGEIVVIESYYRSETFISQISQIHIDYPSLNPPMRKATIDEKQLWYENDQCELILKYWYEP